jgi:hypothetical protein
LVSTNSALSHRCLGSSQWTSQIKPSFGGRNESPPMLLIMF